MHPDQLYELGRLYQQEALQEARMRRLGHMAKGHRRLRSEEQGLWSLLGKLATALRLS